MYDLVSHTQSLTNTWQSSQFQSRIDYIWANHSIIRYLTSYYTDDPKTSTDSDHKILTSSWSFPYAYSGKRRSATKTRKRTFLYKKMNEELWQLYTDQVSTNLSSNNTSTTINTTES